ncbi:MAG: hypothetical protein ACXABD_19135 [Candidatus Thorarchaeota archaeon]
MEQQAAVNLATGIQQGIQNFQAKKEEKKQQQMTSSLLKQYLPEGTDDEAISALARDKDLRNNFFDFLGAQGMAQAKLREAEAEASKLSPAIEKSIFETSIKPKIGDANLARTRSLKAEEGINLLNQGLDTGFGENVKLELKKFGNAFLGTDFDVSDQEVFKSQVEPLMLKYLEETKGAISDREMATFASWSAGLDKDAKSNKRILQSVKNMADRQIKVNNFYADLLMKTNDVRRINLELEKFINDEASNNPIFVGGEGGVSDVSPKVDTSDIITTQEQFNALPSGAEYRESPNGRIFIKP